MALSLSDIRTSVKDNISNDTAATNAKIDKWINLAQDDVERAFLARWISELGTPFLTVANKPEYTLVLSNFRSFIQFWQTDSPMKLINTPYEQFVRTIPDPSTSSTGKPRLWMFLRFTNGLPTIRLYPTPDNNYSINFEYALNLPDLSNDSDVSLISQLGWDSLLINGATKRYYKIHSLQDAVLWDQAFKDDLKSFKAELKQDITTQRVAVDVLRDFNVQVSSLFRYPENFPVR